jgi:hypothetical protein
MEKFILIFLTLISLYIPANSSFKFDYQYPSVFYKSINICEDQRFFDAYYIGIKEESLKEYIKIFVEATELTQFRIDGFDCDNYAMLFKTLSNVYNDKVKQSFEIAIGVALVDMKKDALGIKASFKHAVNIVWTDKGWLIVEPQNGQYCKLEDYPNEITWVLF